MKQQSMVVDFLQRDGKPVVVSGTAVPVDYLNAVGNSDLLFEMAAAMGFLSSAYDMSEDAKITVHEYETVEWSEDGKKFRRLRVRNVYHPPFTGQAAISVSQYRRILLTTIKELCEKQLPENQNGKA